MAVAQQEMQSLLQQALSAQQSGNLAATEQACRQVLAINAEEPNALQFPGLLQRQKGDAAAAIAGYEKAIEIQADYVPAHETLNQYYWEFGEHDKFTLSYPPAIKRAGQSAELRIAFARSLPGVKPALVVKREGG